MQKYLQDPKHIRQLTLLFLLAGFALISIETRYEHQVVLIEKPQAWTPIIYGAVISTIIVANLIIKRPLPRLLLTIGFAVGVIVGILGFWFHTKGVPIDALNHIVEVIFTAPGRILAEDEQGPPVLAPLAVIGLSLIGMTVSRLKDE